uniref:Chalcone synthase n=1 Tax=Oryza sativa subsp. japonica TaxID=39947 RepID=Q9FW79_ORYSJ|nr:putative chalcone synthase [Oryza sativa Japonica Group]
MCEMPLASKLDDRCFGYPGLLFCSRVDGGAAAISVPSDHLVSPPPPRGLRCTLFNNMDAWLTIATDGEVDPVWRSALLIEELPLPRHDAAPRRLAAASLYMHGCSTGCSTLRLAKDIAENNRGACVLVACAEVFLIAWWAVPARFGSAVRLETGMVAARLGMGMAAAWLGTGIVAVWLFGDGSGAVVVGTDPRERDDGDYGEEDEGQMAGGDGEQLHVDKHVAGGRRSSGVGGRARRQAAGEQWLQARRRGGVSARPEQAERRLQRWQAVGERRLLAPTKQRGGGRGGEVSPLSLSPTGLISPTPPGLLSSSPADTRPQRGYDGTLCLNAVASVYLQSWTWHINGSHVNKTTATSSRLNDAANDATTEDHGEHARPPPLSPIALACFARCCRCSRLSPLPTSPAATALTCHRRPCLLLPPPPRSPTPPPPTLLPAFAYRGCARPPSPCPPKKTREEKKIKEKREER